MSRLIPLYPYASQATAGEGETGREASGKTFKPKTHHHQRAQKQSRQWRRPFQRESKASTPLRTGGGVGVWTRQSSQLI